METKKRKPDIELEKNDTTPVMSSSPTTLMSLRSGTVSIVEAVAVNLPDVFAAEIVPKLDWESTLNLAQVNKSYRDAVWSVAGARSFHEKLRVFCDEAYGCSWPLGFHRGGMCWAAGCHNLRAVTALLESGMDVNRIDRVWDGFTALHVAAYKGHRAVVKVLIDAGADVNTRDTSNRLHLGTPLFLAARNGHASVVHQLIKAGANVHLSTSDGLTPLAIAKNYGHCGCEKALIDAGA